ncbi:hypothetical protein EZS27_001024 [termite gut metagenome]|uniref:Right handed beta helix domain-containing protein n=1 Tax=termite gut metagenome TaxID=433724 RepID=A0A5J4T1W0_9ZZZZ
MNEGVGLELMDLVLDGTGAATGNQAIIYTEGTFGDLKIENCEIKKYVKGTLYVSDKSLIESVTITGCIYSNIDCTGGDFIDFRKGLTKTLTFTNNTVCNSATSRDLFRMDADGSTNFPEIKSIVTIANNTFDNVCSTSGRMLYIRLANHEVTFNKNIISNSLGTYYASSQYVLTIAQMSQNNYYEAPNYTTAATNRKIDTSSDLTQLNPGYSNASGGIFKVTNAQLISDGIGDPRWLK